MQAVETDSGQGGHVGDVGQAHGASSWDGLKGPGLEQAGTKYLWGPRAGISLSTEHCEWPQ